MTCPQGQAITGVKNKCDKNDTKCKTVINCCMVGSEADINDNKKNIDDDVKEEEECTFIPLETDIGNEENEIECTK